MNTDQLKNKAQPLIRKVQLFVPATDSDEKMAYANEDESLRFLVQHKEQWMGLTEDQNEFNFHPADLETVDLHTYIPLTKTVTEVYPPFETLMHYGDEEIQTWIVQNDGDKDDLSSLVAFVPDEYTDMWMDSHPMYSNDNIFAYEGGWAITWPEDDVPMQWNEDLDFLFQVGLQNEPFVEVFFDRKKKIYICMERNT